MQHETLICSKPAPHIREVRLNRPENLNAIHETVVGELTSALKDAAEDNETRVVILSGEGRAFCAGADYKKHATRPASERPAYLRGLLGVCRDLFTHPKPIVAALHGLAIGAGAEMAVNCDFILIAEETEVRFPEIAIGTFIGGGVTNLLPRLVGLARARELLMMCEPITAKEAVAIGFANKCFPKASFRDDVLNFAKRLSERAPIPVGLLKKTVNSEAGDSYTDSWQAEYFGVLTCMNSSDWCEGVQAFAEKRRPEFTGT